MIRSICRVCGKLFETETGEVLGPMVFGEPERGKLICMECLRQMNPEKEAQDLWPDR